MDDRGLLKVRTEFFFRVACRCTVMANEGVPDSFVFFQENQLLFDGPSLQSSPTWPLPREWCIQGSVQSIFIGKEAFGSYERHGYQCNRKHRQPGMRTSTALYGWIE